MPPAPRLQVQGIGALTPCAEPSLLALPAAAPGGPGGGAIRVYDTLREGGREVLCEIPAHKSALASGDSGSGSGGGVCICAIAVTHMFGDVKARMWWYMFRAVRMSGVGGCMCWQRGHSRWGM